MQTKFSGLTIGQIVVNKKTSKRWLVTEFITAYSSVKSQSVDEFKVRLSNGGGKTVLVSVDALNKNYHCEGN